LTPDLAERIEKAIAENACPYTTEADIRYYIFAYSHLFETEEGDAS